MRAQVASELLALRDADVEALQLHFAAQEAIAAIAASDPRIVASAAISLRVVIGIPPPFCGRRSRPSCGQFSAHGWGN